MMATELSPAANAAANVYVELYESLCEEQQVQQAMGNPLHARKASYNAHIVRAAIDAELNDPEPEDEPYRICCGVCTVWHATRGVR